MIPVTVVVVTEGIGRGDSSGSVLCSEGKEKGGGKGNHGNGEWRMENGERRKEKYNISGAMRWKACDSYGFYGFKGQ